MHRSGSTSRVADEFYSGGAPPAAMGRLSLPGASGQRVVTDQLPKYNPLSEVTRREAARVRLAENAVHIIPVVLIVCGFVLWLFSSPHIGVVNKDTPIVTDNKNPTINGFSNGTISSLGTYQEVVDSVEQLVLSKANRRMLANEDTE